MPPCEDPNFACPPLYFIHRGQLDPSRDNTSIITEILALRLEQAQMHGFDSFAAYATADTMAQTTDSVMDLLLKVPAPLELCSACCIVLCDPCALSLSCVVMF